MKKTFLYSLLLFAVTSLSAQTDKYPQRENTHRIMTYNIRNGIGMDNKTDLKRIANVIESAMPEVVAVQEIDSMTQRSGGIDVLKELSNIVKMHAIYAPAIDYDGGKYGVGLLSKQRALNTKSIPLPGKEEKRTVLVAEFDKYVVCATHWSLTLEDRQVSAKIISDLAKQYDKPVLLAGDFNAEPDSDEIKSMGQDWKILSSIRQATYPSKTPTEKLDHVLGYTAKGKQYAILRSAVIEDSIASDHRPVFVDVRFPMNTDEVMRTAPYLQNPDTDGMTIMWLTNVPARSWVEYGTNINDLKRERTIVEGMAMANNEINRIRLHDLKANTKYYYRVVSQEILRYEAYYKEFGDTVRSDISSFTTWNTSAKDFTAIIYNDIHDNHELFDQLANLVKDIDYDFVIYNGDCLSDVHNEAAAVRSIDHYSQKMDGSNIPSIFIRGNHEIRSAYSPFLWNLLDKKGGGSTYSGFNYGDTRFVMLDAGEDKPDDFWVYYDMNDFTQYRLDQVEFLKKELASKEFKAAKRKILVHHIPLFGENQDKYRPTKELWGPILAKGNFDMSLNAHTHIHEFIPKGKDGNTYPVMIGGGNNLKTGTVTILKKTGERMNITVLDTKGEKLLNFDF